MTRLRSFRFSTSLLNSSQTRSTRTTSESDLRVETLVTSLPASLTACRLCFNSLLMGNPYY